MRVMMHIQLVVEECPRDEKVDLEDPIKNYLSRNPILLQFNDEAYFTVTLRFYKCFINLACVDFKICWQVLL